MPSVRLGGEVGSGLTHTHTHSSIKQIHEQHVLNASAFQINYYLINEDFTIAQYLLTLSILVSRKGKILSHRENNANGHLKFPPAQQMQ